MLAERVGRQVEILDVDHEAVPSSRLGSGPVGHRLTAATLTARGTEGQAQVASSQHGEGGCRMHLLGEAEVSGIERDRLIDVIDDVADAYGSHSPFPYSTLRP